MIDDGNRLEQDSNRGPLGWEAPALLLLCLGWPALASMGLAQEEPPKKRLDLSSFRPPSFDQPVTGTFKYESPLSGAELSMVIRETQEDGWQFEGVANESGSHPLLRLERAPKSIAYRGRTEIEFDPCLGDQARVESAVVYAEQLSLVVLVPHSSASRGKECGPLDFTVLPRDASTKTRLKARGELGLTAVDVDGSVSQSYGREVGMPRIGDDVPVRVTDTLVADSGVRWCHVTALAATDDEGDPLSGWVRAEQVLARVRYTLKRM